MTPGFVREDRGYLTPCLVWTGAQAGSCCKYGVRVLAGRRFYVHREAWERAHGPIPAGMCVCHHCDVGLCVELSHLFLGTQAENLADMAAKGRRRTGLPGEAHHMARLTAAAVRQIRSSGEPARVFAARFGVSESAVRQARRGVTWRLE